MKAIDTFTIICSILILCLVIVLGIGIVKINCLEDVAVDLCDGSVIERDYSNYKCVNQNTRIANQYYFTIEDKAKCQIWRE